MSQRAATILEVVLLAVPALILARFILLVAFGASAGDFALDSSDSRNAAARSADLEYDLENADFSQLFADRRQTAELVVHPQQTPINFLTN